jgi:lipoic acid synthetase
MINRLPSWFEQELPDKKTSKVRQILSGFGVNTVCQLAQCPNINSCFKSKQLTFMILGNACTRNCRFCNVSGRGEVLYSLTQCGKEIYNIAQVVKILDLKYVVITSVCRDDLDDGGAGFFAKTIEAIQEVNQGIKVEVLIPDFHGEISSLEHILNAGPFIVAHNIETVERLYSDLRPMADYRTSLGVLNKIKELNPQTITKSSLMLGLGETEEEVIHAMRDLRERLCDILTLGQYLAPSINHYPVKEFINPVQFQKYKEIGKAIGFKSVLSAPLVRSSLHAEEVFKETINV